MFKAVKKKRRRLYGGWLVLGLIQLALIVAFGMKSDDSLFSQVPAEAAERVVSAGVAPIPVRISRTIFENELSASISVDHGQPIRSPVRWNENAESLPQPPSVPGETPLMVNQDHIGCAEISHLSPMRLCFRIQADVDSLALRADQMWIEGIRALRDPGCIQTLKLTEAIRIANGFSLIYRMIPTTQPSCPTRPRTLSLTITDPVRSEVRSVSYRYSR